MSKHREHLMKLGHDVQMLEKKLERVFGEDGDSIQKEGKIVASSKMSAKNSPRNSSIRKVCDQRKSKGQPRASVEVTVKTKCSGKSKKNKPKSIASVLLAPSNLAVDNKLESHRTPEHSHSKSSTMNKQNLKWNNILKHSGSDNTHADTNTKKGETAEKASEVQRDIAISKEIVGEITGCPNCKNLVSGRNQPKPDQHQANDGGVMFAPANPIGSLRNEIACQTGIKKNCGTYLSNDEMKHQGLLESKRGSPMEPIETLSILLQELNQKLAVEDESTRKLAGEMHLTLRSLVETMSAAGFYSGPSSFLVSKLSSRDISEHNSKLPKGNEIKGNYTDRNEIGIPKKQNIVYEKNFEIPVKLVDDKEIQVNLSSDLDGKMRLEIEYLKKQLDIQLKSVDRVTDKESEYHSLLVSLLDKVKNLEKQVTEQRKGTDCFLLQNNILKEQNSVIPVLKASQEMLQKRLQQNLEDYEKLKVDYHLLWLEKEKYCALNDAKDKEIKWFQEEIRNVQLLVEEQMDNLRKVDKLETTGINADALINIIDKQANLIKSKLGLTTLGEEASTSYLSIPSQSVISCDVSSTKSASKKPDPVPPAGLDSSKHSVDNLFNHYTLNIPEIQSPNSS